MFSIKTSGGGKKKTQNLKLTAVKDLQNAPSKISDATIIFPGALSGIHFRPVHTIRMCGTFVHRLSNSYTGSTSTGDAELSPSHTIGSFSSRFNYGRMERTNNNNIPRRLFGIYFLLQITFNHINITKQKQKKTFQDLNVLAWSSLTDI